jgi:hypothetical protein
VEKTGESMPRLLLVTLILIFTAFISCSGGGNDSDDDDGGQDYSDDDTNADCTTEQMCAKGVECGGWSDADECLAAWSGAEGECADPDGVFSCSCDCMDQTDDCDELLDCASNCALQYCV